MKSNTATSGWCAVVRLATLGFALLALTPMGQVAEASEQEDADVAAWRAERIESLTSPTGWLTLEGLFWLRPGANSFGSGKKAQLRLEQPQLPSDAGVFVLDGKTVRFIARPGANITQSGRPITSVEMAADTSGEPSILAIGSLEFFVIERGGQFGVRVRDRESPRRRDFKGLSYFPIDESWIYSARFEPYQPARVVPIMNILGMEVPMVSPGAIVFERGGREWRLDTVLEDPNADELFIMFTDGTSGRTTYGGGRFLKAPRARDGTVRVDFNRSYNPPCAFNTFATCPLPPPQNRLELAISAGELKYSGGPH